MIDDERDNERKEKKKTIEREDILALRSDQSESMADISSRVSMTTETCTNADCLHRQSELRLARLREDLLNNFNNLLLDRIRFLEQTITRLNATTPTMRRSSSATAYFLPNPMVRSCPSSVDLSANSSHPRQYLAIPIHSRPWTSSTSDLPSTLPSHEKTRLESRRFACDVDDNDIRALKAMVYMDRARKAHARPLHRLRQVFRIR